MVAQDVLYGLEGCYPFRKLPQDSLSEVELVIHEVAGVDVHVLSRFRPLGLGLVGQCCLGRR